MASTAPHMIRIRPDQVPWVSGRPGRRVWWIDPDTGARQTAQRAHVRVWAWVGAKTLYANLITEFESVAPRSLAVVLHTWRRESADAALTDLAAMMADLDTIVAAIDNDEINVTP